MVTRWNLIIKGILLLLVFTLSACSRKAEKHSTPQPIDLYAEAKGETHVFLGANVPYGTVRIGPQTRGTDIERSKGYEEDEEVGRSRGYNYNDSIITGFVISYTGEAEEAIEINHKDDISFFPTIKGENETPFVHHYEVVKPGYYSVYMHEADIAVEVTATRNVAYQRYFFPPTDSAQVVIDKELIVLNDSTLAGKTPSTHFIVQLSQPLKQVVAPQNNIPQTTLIFDTTDEEMLYIKVGLSPKSMEDAQSLIANELPEWNYELAIAEATQSWNEYLTKE